MNEISEKFKPTYVQSYEHCEKSVLSSALFTFVQILSLITSNRNRVLMGLEINIFLTVNFSLSFMSCPLHRYKKC